MNIFAKWRAEDGRVFGSDPHNDGEVLICDTAPDGSALTDYDAANASLIAAAPDLLAACESLCGVFEGYEDVPRYVSKARAAIAKAKG